MKKLYLILCSMVLTSAYAELHPLNPYDLNSLQRISNPHISPNGEKLLLVVKKTDINNNNGQRNIRLLDINGSEHSTALTKHSSSNSNPLWSANGLYIYFLSNRSGSTQIWRMKANGKQQKQLTKLPISPSNLQISPDNQYLAFSADVYRDCPTFECTHKRDQKVKNQLASGIAYQQLFVRHWDTWENGKQTHLFTLKLNDKGNITGEPIPITTKLNANVPPKPFGGNSDFTFSADSQSIFFTARVASNDQAWVTNLDIFKAAADGSGEINNLTKANKAVDTHPVISHNGKWLAYLAMQRPGFESDRLQIKLLNLHNNELSIIAPDWDHSINEFKFSSDDQFIFATAYSFGQKPLFSIDLQNKQIKQLTEAGHISEFDINKNTITYTRNTFSTPNQLFQMQTDGSNNKAILALDHNKLSNIAMGEYAQYSFSGWNQEKVYGYIFKPANFEPQKKYPAILFIHGGPQGNFGNRFHYRWNPQVFAGAGYAVIIIDFHGSTGYGQAFTDSISGDWGGKPLIDLQKGLAAALKQSSWIDGDHICAMGGSYGGYMVNWIAGAWPKRFKCLVNHDGVFDNRMMYYSTEELWFPEWEHGGPYFQNPQGHEKHNPVNLVTSWQTPMLVIHGGQDFRIPDTQSIAAFTALQRQGIKSRLLYFPDENHWVLKPQNSIQWHKEILKWLDEHLKSND